MPDKRELARAGTMDVTTKEGKAYLDKNLTPWLKPHIMAHFKDDEAQKTPTKRKAGKAKKTPAKKVRLSKGITMVQTAKEGRSLLQGEDLASTRQQSKDKKSTTTKSKVNFASGTSKPKLKRASTMAKTIAEAQIIISKTSNPRSPKVVAKKAAKKSTKLTKKPQLNKGRTMALTAKDAAVYLQNNPAKNTKRGGKKK